MYRFLMGLAVGYLTMTESGQEVTKKLTEGLRKTTTDYLKQEGVIEPSKDARPTEPTEPDNKPEEQCSPSETVDE